MKQLSPTIIEEIKLCCYMIEYWHGIIGECVLETEAYDIEEAYDLYFEAVRDIEHNIVGQFKESVHSDPEMNRYDIVTLIRIDPTTFEEEYIRTFPDFKEEM